MWSLGRGRSKTPAILTLLILAAACSPTQPYVTSCEDVDRVHPICDLQNPEDIAVVAAGSPLILSQMGSMTDTGRGGSLALLDLGLEVATVVYPTDRSEGLRPSNGWGDAACPGEPLNSFNPHGLDLAPRPDGRLRLIVVNHGGRESIEFFEVTPQAETVSVEWRGCALLPEDLFVNDVVNLPNGGLLATHMFTGNTNWGFLRASLGVDTGAVYEWQREAQWALVAGTDAPFPNGIELSEDGSEIYLNVYSGAEVRRISRVTGETLAVAQVPSPDNSSWGRDGRLLVASHTAGVADSLQCQQPEPGSCPMAFQIVSLDPRTLESQRVFENEGAPMGAGTIAVDLGEEWVIGSFAGDRVIRVPKPEAIEPEP